MKLLRIHRHLLLALLFAAATIVAWNFAYRAYTRSLGVIETDGTRHPVTLDHVNEQVGAFPGLILEQWLGPEGAGIVRQQRVEYRGRCAAALLCGFMTVFLLGMYLDRLKSRNAQAPEPSPAG